MDNNVLIVKIDEKQIRAIAEAVAEALCATEAKYFNKKDSAKYLKCSTVTLWEYERKGWINPIQIGSRMMYTKGELDRFASGVKGNGK